MNLLCYPTYAVRRVLRYVRSRLRKFAIDRGLPIKNKWRKLPADSYGKYLDDGHPGRHWFVEFVKQEAPCKVLEVGAGSLHEARLLFRQGSETPVDYTVVDVAKEMFTQGRLEFPTIHFIEGDINFLRLSDDVFDAVYCRHVLEHQPYYERPIREMLRVSKGLVVINVFRWSLHRDIIRFSPDDINYSNSYEISKFLTFIAGLGAGYEYCLVFKDKKLGKNLYEDENIRRTMDHLIIVIVKRGTWVPEQLYDPLDQIRAVYQRRPYDKLLAA